MEITLADIFKPDCKEKICCMFCPKEKECLKSCMKNEEMKDVPCKSCFYEKQSKGEANKIFAKNND